MTIPMKINGIGVRMFLYPFIAGLTTASSWVSDAPASVGEVSWKMWALLISSTSLSAAIAFRAFIDGSAEREKQNGKPV